MIIKKKIFFKNIHYQQTEFSSKKEIDEDNNNSCESILIPNLIANIDTKSIVSINIIIIEKNKVKIIEKLEQEDSISLIYLNHEVNENGNIKEWKEEHPTIIDLTLEVFLFSKKEETLKDININNLKENNNTFFHLYDDILKNAENDYNHIARVLVK